MINTERQPIIETLMQRDKITREEATKIRNNLKRDLMEYVENGDLMGAEELIQDEIGLEPDYLDELIF